MTERRMYSSPRPESHAEQLNRLDFSIRRFYVDQFHVRHVPALPVGSWVLDLGGNLIAKRGVFDIGRYNLRVVYANLSTAKQPDVQADAACLPFTDGCFDAVICAELLEHVPRPPVVLHETHRVLTAGGTLLITVPFLYQIHGDPYDYGRYTETYWRENLAQIGFTNITIERQGLFWSVLVDMLRAWAYYRQQRGGRRHIPAKLLRAGLRWLIARGKHRVVKWDAAATRQCDPFLSAFTTGFGIRCTRA